MNSETRAYWTRLAAAIVADAMEALAGRKTTRRADAVRAEWQAKIDALKNSQPVSPGVPP